MKKLYKISFKWIYTYFAYVVGDNPQDACDKMEKYLDKKYRGHDSRMSSMEFIWTEW
jgi:hypothetical protein